MVHFTKENYETLRKLAADMLFANEVISYGVGQPKSIIELLHTTSIETLNKIKQTLSKKIEEQENKDEWVDPDNSKLDKLRKKKELVNLIIGWKRFNLEKDAQAQKKIELTKKLNDLKESQKTPADRIKELEAELASMNAVEDFQ
jgi:hypothetical protein